MFARYKVQRVASEQHEWDTERRKKRCKQLETNAFSIA